MTNTVFQYCGILININVPTCTINVRNDPTESEAEAPLAEKIFF